MSKSTSEPGSPQGFRPPDTFIILFAVAVLAWLATWLVPAGLFEAKGDGTAITIETYTADAPSRAPLFGTGEHVGFLNFLFEGLVSGDRYGATVGLMAFLLIVGGAFGIIMRTGAMEVALKGLLAGRTEGADWLAPLLFFLFSIAGAVFGMGEEAIVFVMILAPAFIRAGYDSLSAIVCTYVATQVGFATSWMNPFSVVIAQGIAELPILSGAGFRVGVWTLFTLLGALFTYQYARHIRRNPSRSRSHETDTSLTVGNEVEGESDSILTLGHMLILLIVLSGVAWIGWGVAAHQYYFPEIAAQFFTMGLAAALVAVLFRLNRMSLNDCAVAFREGAIQLAPAAIIVGFAKGIVILLGGDDPQSASTLNTVLFHMANLTEGMPATISAQAMFIIQSLVNLVVVSGSGQAALTMPLMAPLADLNGLDRQIAVLAFQLGDGLTNIICPASAALMGSLAVAKVDWTTWVAFFWKYMLGMVLLAILIMGVAVAVGYS